MTRPQDMDGEPWEVAAEAVARVSDALAKVIARFEETATQVRNARMQDALELSPAELHDQYPEAVNEDGRLTGFENSGLAKRPHEDPYEFWARTHDAALAERGKLRLNGALSDVRALEERQPEVGRNAS